MGAFFMSNFDAGYGKIGIYRSSAIALSNNQPASLGLDVNGNLLVNVAASSEATATSASTGQAKITVTSTAVQLSANTLTNGVIISAKSTNAASITIGGASVTNTVDGTGNGYILEAGASVSFAISNTNLLYINGTAGDIISFAGS